MIEFENVFKRYTKHQHALSNVSFKMEAGEFAFLCGHSGAGKSTLLKLILMTEQASRGRVLLNNKNIAAIHPSQIPFARRRIGTIFQEHHLLINKTVFDNVALPLIIAGYNDKDLKKRVHAALDKVGLLNKAPLFPNTLSGGEQQRVGIARAIVNKPLILIADEPTGNLDAELSNEIMTLFEKFHQAGTTVLIATHNLSLIKPHHKILTLRQGELIENAYVEA